MTNKRPAPVGHQALSAQDLAGVPVCFRWVGYSPARGLQEANGYREVRP
jgi:hypothetical protein